MVSPEILRRYPFFGTLTDAQLKAVAMHTEEETFGKGAIVFEECQAADKLYLLLEGGIDLSYKSEEEYHPTTRKEFYVGEINSGEVFGTSALIEPHVLNATAKTSQASKVVTFDASELRKLLEKDQDLSNKFLLQVIKILKERIIALRVQMAAIQP